MTSHDIARGAGVAAGTFYLHFKDKETLVRDLCANDFLALAKTFERIARDPDPLDRLRRVGLAYLEFALSHPNHYRLMFMTPRLHEDDLLKKGNPEEDAYAFLVGTVTRAIDAGALRLELKDPHLVAQAVWGAVHGVVALRIAKGGDPWVDWRPVRRTAELVIDATLRGLRRER